jgi:hypothetical protein
MDRSLRGVTPVQRNAVYRKNDLTTCQGVGYALCDGPRKSRTTHAADSVANQSGLRFQKYAEPLFISSEQTGKSAT